MRSKQLVEIIVFSDKSGFLKAGMCVSCAEKVYHIVEVGDFQGLFEGFGL